MLPTKSITKHVTHLCSTGSYRENRSRGRVVEHGINRNYPSLHYHEEDQSRVKCKWKISDAISEFRKCAEAHHPFYHKVNTWTTCFSPLLQRSGAVQKNSCRIHSMRPPARNTWGHRYIIAPNMPYWTTPCGNLMGHRGHIRTIRDLDSCNKHVRVYANVHLWCGSAVRARARIAGGVSLFALAVPAEPVFFRQ